MSLVQEALNKITQEKINATVKLVPIGFTDWKQQINLMFSSSEKLY
jgi:putative aldouronate transport system substrate-binding protein